MASRRLVPPPLWTPLAPSDVYLALTRNFGTAHLRVGIEDERSHTPGRPSSRRLSARARSWYRGGAGRRVPPTPWRPSCGPRRPVEQSPAQAGPDRRPAAAQPGAGPCWYVTAG